jgi:hypothetical protein
MMLFCHKKRDQQGLLPVTMSKAPVSMPACSAFSRLCGLPRTWPSHIGCGSFISGAHQHSCTDTCASVSIDVCDVVACMLAGTCW